jgi:hypothetical protein
LAELPPGPALGELLASVDWSRYGSEDLFRFAELQAKQVAHEQASYPGAGPGSVTAPSTLTVAASAIATARKLLHSRAKNQQVQETCVDPGRHDDAIDPTLTDPTDQYWTHGLDVFASHDRGRSHSEKTKVSPTITKIPHPVGQGVARAGRPRKEQRVHQTRGTISAIPRTARSTRTFRRAAPTWIAQIRDTLGHGS